MHGAGGPNLYASGNRRTNYTAVLSCKAYPCTKTLYYSYATPGGGTNSRSSTITFASEAERNASLPAFRAEAQREFDFEQALLRIKLEAEETRQHMLDMLWRWESMGWVGWAGVGRVGHA